MGTFTPNLNLFRPDPSESMADVKKNINDNFKAIRDYVTPPVVVSLPLVGSVGDLVYMAGSGHYICVAVDVNWGIFWRPIQAAAGPWITVPQACILGANNVNAADWPLSIMLDNRGLVHLRGSIKNDVNGFPDAVPPAGVQVLRQLPVGIRPVMTMDFLLPTETAPNTFSEYAGGRMELNKDGNSIFNFWHSAGAFYLFFDTVWWPAGEGTYYSG